jgi:hypothetical protein
VGLRLWLGHRWCSVDPDGDRARLALAAKLAYYGPSIAPWLLARAGLRPDDFAPAAAALAGDGMDAAARLVTPAMLRLGIAGGARGGAGALPLAARAGRHPPVVSAPTRWPRSRSWGREVLPRLDG